MDLHPTDHYNKTVASAGGSLHSFANLVNDLKGTSIGRLKDTRLCEGAGQTLG